jgi:hypothetical protein
MSWPRVFIRREIEQKKCDPPMNTPSTTSEYLLLIRNTTWHKSVSPKDIQKLLKQFTTWAERLSNEGKIKRGYPLAPEGKIIARSKAVTDAALAETKEAIAGYLVIQVDSLEEAAEIAKGAPCLDYGQTLEVRPIIAEPSELQFARQQIANEQLV